MAGESCNEAGADPREPASELIQIIGGHARPCDISALLPKPSGQIQHTPYVAIELSPLASLRKAAANNARV
jgi:hypothetical protein